MPLTAAQNAQKTAEKLLEWTSNPSHAQHCMRLERLPSSVVVSQLETCFVGTEPCLKHSSEIMQQNLFTLSAPVRFKACWYLCFNGYNMHVFQCVSMDPTSVSMDPTCVSMDPTCASMDPISSSYSVYPFPILPAHAMCVVKYAQNTSSELTTSPNTYQQYLELTASSPAHFPIY